MDVYDSVQARAPLFKRLLERLGVVELATGITPELDLSSKVSKPETFTTGEFLTYNTTTEELESTGKTADDFVQDANYVHTAQNFTTEYKALLDNLPEAIPSPSGLMPMVEPTTGNLSDILVLDAEGKAIASGYKVSGMWSGFARIIAAGAYPSTFGANLIAVTENTLAIRIHYILTNADRTRRRAVETTLFIIGGTTILPGANESRSLIDTSLGEDQTNAEDFASEVEYIIADGMLQISYTAAAGTDATTLTAKCIEL